MRQAITRALLSISLASTMVGIGAALMPVEHAPASASAPSVRWTLPPVHAAFDYQIGGPYRPAGSTGTVVRDWHVRPAAGVYNVCYVDAFQTQPEAKRWWLDHHPDLLLHRDGALVEDANWPEQYVLDTSTSAKRADLAAIERGWISSCARRGYDAVELDNLDSWTRSGGSLDPQENLALARALVSTAHRLGLAAAQKNAAVLRSTGRRVARFDFAIAESCEVYRECAAYTDVYGRHVYEIEYTDESGSPFRTACAARGARISVTLRDRMVVPRGRPGYRSDSC